MANVDTGVIEERPLRELVLQLSRDASQLVEQEIALAKQEAREKVEQLQTAVSAVSAGALVLHIGLAALAAALILLLAQALPTWLAALIIGAGLCVVGALMLAKGKRELQQVDLKPGKTVRSVEQDVEAIKEAVK
jgi:Flp pilus assembly protein TadB